MTDTLNEGDKAPDFELATQAGTVRLKDIKGQVVVLYFYPKDDTSGCTVEAKEFSARTGEFKALGVRVIGVSKDTVASHTKFTGKHGLDVELGSAAETDAVERYGAWVQKSMYGRTYMGIDRSTFLIDADGLIHKIWRKVKATGHAAEVLKAVREINTV
jgi:peroxiredoxin Q/BCP